MKNLTKLVEANNMANVETQVAPKREKRIPVSGPRDILTVTNMNPNYHYRWVNDIPGRIPKFQEGGWEIVNHEAEVGGKTVDRGSRLGSAVTKRVGNQVEAVLMRIPLEWYIEDQKAKQEQVNDLEATMRPAEADYGSISIKRK